MAILTILLALFYIIFILNEFNQIKFRAENKYIFFLLIIFSLSTALLVYFLFTNTVGDLYNVPSEEDHKRANLGVLGDYFGGLLNPMFAFLSFMALLMTLKYQSKQIKQTTEQLKQNEIALEETRKAVQQNEKALEQNAEALTLNNLELVNSTKQLSLATKAHQEIENTQKLQQFENLFFSLLNQLTIKISEFRIEASKKNLDSTYKKIFDLTSTNYKEMQKCIINNRELSNFYIFLYQILKSIDLKLIKNEAKKDYSNIVRSLIPAEILHLLMINCAVPDNHDFFKFKKLLEKFNFFEHITLHQDGKIHQMIILYHICTKYDVDVFGNNNDFKHFKDSILLANLKEKCNLSEILYNIVMDSKNFKKQQECSYEQYNFDYLNDSDIAVATHANTISFRSPHQETINISLVFQSINNMRFYTGNLYLKAANQWYFMDLRIEQEHKIILNRIEEHTIIPKNDLF